MMPPMGPANPMGPVYGPLRRPMTYTPPPARGPLPGGPRMALGSFKKGGKVKKTGLYKLHKGERVLRSKLSDLK